MTKIVPPSALKDPEYKNCLTLDKFKKTRINAGLTMSSENRVDLLNVINKDYDAVDVSELASALELNASEEEAKERITTAPEEAIVVVFDKSGSMNNDFENKDFTRLAATKQFFENFADRTIGYSYRHVISLILFDNKTSKACDFTENICTFSYHVQNSSANGGTALWDAIIEAVDSLIEFKQQYPQCTLRILCLSDGNDVHSTHSSFDAAEKLIKASVVIDSIVVGSTCNNLKAVSFASGGYCFYPGTLQNGIRLFESETFLSVRNRVPKEAACISTTNDLEPYLNQVFSSDLPLMRTPEEIKSRFEVPTTVIHRVTMCPPPVSSIASAIQIKRIMRELRNLTNNPHPDISVYPCENSTTFWNVFLKGPEYTPYQGGVFRIYINFTEDYPASPPEIRFVTPIYHCNINSNGKICHAALGQFYRTDTTIRYILDCIYGLLMAPEPTHPLDAYKADEYLNNRDQYSIAAAEFTMLHASKSLQELTQGVATYPTTPSHFLDPITGRLMEDPVLCIKSNKTYERSEIERVIQTTGRDPLTDVKITSEDLLDSIPLKQAIAEFRQGIDNPWWEK